MAVTMKLTNLSTADSTSDSEAHRERSIDAFVDVLQCLRSEAEFFLESSNWDVETAVVLWLENNPYHAASSSALSSSISMPLTMPMPMSMMAQMGGRSFSSSFMNSQLSNAQRSTSAASVLAAASVSALVGEDGDVAVVYGVSGVEAGSDFTLEQQPLQQLRTQQMLLDAARVQDIDIPTNRHHSIAMQHTGRTNDGRSISNSSSTVHQSQGFSMDEENTAHANSHENSDDRNQHNMTSNNAQSNSTVAGSSRRYQWNYRPVLIAGLPDNWMAGVNPYDGRIYFKHLHTGRMQYSVPPGFADAS